MRIMDNALRLICTLVRNNRPSGGFKGGPKGAQAHPVIGPLLVTC